MPCIAILISTRQGSLKGHYLIFKVEATGILRVHSSFPPYVQNTSSMAICDVFSIFLIWDLVIAVWLVRCKQKTGWDFWYVAWPHYSLVSERLKLNSTRLFLYYQINI
jgi:hypothetical protein